MFLTADDLRTLTGRSRADAQIAALRRMGIPYWLNAAGKPVVATETILGGKASKPRTWEPRHGSQA